MAPRGEVILRDLGELCAPAGRISPRRRLDCWNAVRYDTAEGGGSMLTALGEARPGPVTLDPGLVGWYRIYVGIPYCWLSEATGGRSNVELKLSGDPAFQHFSQDLQGPCGRSQIQESFWRCADMTGQSVTVAKTPRGKALDALVAWFRFVPMDETEVAAFLADQARTDTRCLYAANDLHGMLCLYGAQGQQDWRSAVQELAQSDAEWLSVEDIGVFDGEPSTGSADDFAFPRPADERAQRLLKREHTPEMLRDLIAFGRGQGLKMCVSLRMGAWGMEFPFDQMLFANSFAAAHPEFSCVDRDGQAISALSYAYPQVQDYIIGRLTAAARLGADAVELIAVRGLPYLLYEPPVLDAFSRRFGDDARYLPQEDERYLAVRCSVMTGFFRRLRAALDEAAGKGKTRIHLRGMYSLYDNSYVGFDLEALAREGLVDAIISYPQRARETLSGDVWQDEGHTRLDLKKYTRYAREKEYPLFSRPSDFIDIDPAPDLRGVPRGPESPAARVAELMALEKEYGVQLYFELLPRLTPPEELQRRVRDLRSWGAGRFSLWDVYSRAPRRIYWSMARRLGHREALEDGSAGEGALFRRVRVLRYDGMDVSRYTPSWGG